MKIAQVLNAPLMEGATSLRVVLKVSCVPACPSPLLGILQPGLTQCVDELNKGGIVIVCVLLLRGEKGKFLSSVRRVAVEIGSQSGLPSLSRGLAHSELMGAEGCPPGLGLTSMARVAMAHHAVPTPTPAPRWAPVCGSRVSSFVASGPAPHVTTPQACRAISEDAGVTSGITNGALMSSLSSTPAQDGKRKPQAQPGHDFLVDSRVLLLQSHICFREGWGSMSPR